MKSPGIPIIILLPTCGRKRIIYPLVSEINKSVHWLGLNFGTVWIRGEY